ncbi:Unknown [Rickettsia africae ESF-5]|uniref:RPE1 domain protein n=1 Tax=Rickettsia africae (strain ESF-5) TaxID=347255 RepID=C3PLQ2_RICAE|nr:palindromic element RPE1 domain-containing protein [Rickettsia africae]ACP53892.1 Unknown [Rickettsia africae ESF-5]
MGKRGIDFEAYNRSVYIICENYKQISSVANFSNRHLQKLAYREEFEEDTAHRTTAYIEVREDSSTGSTYKLPLVVEFPKM